MWQGRRYNQDRTFSVPSSPPCLSPPPTPSHGQPLKGFHWKAGILYTVGFRVWFITLSMIFLIGIHITMCVSSVRLIATCSAAWRCPHLFVNSPVGGPLCYFQFGVIMNNCALNIWVCFFHLKYFYQSVVDLKCFRCITEWFNYARAHARLVAQCVRLLQPHGLYPARLLHPWHSPGKNTGAGCHFLLQGIFPIQGSSPGLLHCNRTLYWQSYEGCPYIHYTHPYYFSDSFPL